MAIFKLDDAGKILLFPDSVLGILIGLPVKFQLPPHAGITRQNAQTQFTIFQHISIDVEAASMLSIFDDPVFDFSDLRVLMIKLVQFSIIMIPKLCVARFRYLSWDLKSRHVEKTLKNLMIFKFVWFAEFVCLFRIPRGWIMLSYI